VGPRPVVGCAPAGRKFSQIPERSGLPSAVLGAGASKSGLPSAVLGTPAVGWGGHCPHSATALANTIARVFIVTDYPAKCAFTHRLALVFPSGSTTSRFALPPAPPPPCNRVARSSSALPTESLDRSSESEKRHSRSCREGLRALGVCRYLTGPTPLRVKKRTPAVGGKFSGWGPKLVYGSRRAGRI
jgi:hypothetical protein